MGAFMERNVSAMISSRAMADWTRASGPQAAIQEVFICGRPQTLLIPESTKVRQAGLPVAKLVAGWVRA